MTSYPPNLVMEYVAKRSNIRTQLVILGYKTKISILSELIEIPIESDNIQIFIVIRNLYEAIMYLIRNLCQSLNLLHL